MTSKISYMTGVIVPPQEKQSEFETTMARIFERARVLQTERRGRLIRYVVQHPLAEIDVYTQLINTYIAEHFFGEGFPPLCVEEVLIQRVQEKKGIKQYLTDHLPKDFPWKEYVSPAMMAAALGMRDLMEILSHEEKTPRRNLLVSAIEGGQNDLIDELIEGPFLGCASCTLYWYPVQSAVRLRDFPLLKKLIERGFNVNFASRLVDHPLIIAGQMGDLEALKLLRELGAVCVVESDNSPYHIFENTNLKQLSDEILAELVGCPSVKGHLVAGRYIFNALRSGVRTFNFFVQFVSDKKRCYEGRGHNLITWIAKGCNPKLAQIEAVCKHLDINQEDAQKRTVLDVISQAGKFASLSDFSTRGANRISSDSKVALKTIGGGLNNATKEQFAYYLDAAKNTYPGTFSDWYKLLHRITKKTPTENFALLLPFLFKNGVSISVIILQLRGQEWYTPEKGHVLIRESFRLGLEPSDRSMLLSKVIDWGLYVALDQFDFDGILEKRGDDIVIHGLYGIPDGFSCQKREKNTNWRLLLIGDFIRERFGTFEAAQKYCAVNNPAQVGREIGYVEFSLLFDEPAKRVMYLYEALNCLTAGDLYSSQEAQPYLPDDAVVLGSVPYEKMWPPQQKHMELAKEPIEQLRDYLPKEEGARGIDRILDYITNKKSAYGMPNAFSFPEKFSKWHDDFSRDLSAVLGAAQQRDKEEQVRFARDMNEAGEECAATWRATLDLYYGIWVEKRDHDVLSQLYKHLAQLASDGLNAAVLAVPKKAFKGREAHIPNLCARVIQKKLGITPLRSLYEDSSMGSLSSDLNKSIIDAFTSVYNPRAIVAIIDQLEEEFPADLEDGSVRKWVIDHIPPNYVSPEIEEIKAGIKEPLQRDWLIKSGIFPRYNEEGEKACLRTVAAHFLLESGDYQSTKPLIDDMPINAPLLTALKERGILLRPDESVAKGIERVAKASYLLGCLERDPSTALEDFGHLVASSDISQDRAKKRATEATVETLREFCEEVRAGERRSLHLDLFKLPVDPVFLKESAIQAYLELLAAGKSSMTPTFRRIAENLRDRGALQRLSELEEICRFRAIDALLVEKTGLIPHPNESTGEFFVRAKHAAYAEHITDIDTGKVKERGKWNFLFAIDAVISKFYLINN